MMMSAASSSKMSAMMWLRWISSRRKRWANTVTKIGLQEKMTATTDTRVYVTDI